MRQLQYRCRRLLRDLQVPQPFSVEALTERLALQRGRPLHVRPLPGNPIPGGPYGLWLATADEDYIIYERHTSPLHREHIVLHEIGHMLMHQFGGSHCEPSTDERLRAERLSRLARHLDPDVVSRILTRDHCSTVEEREAEMIASLILERVDRTRPVSWGDGMAGRLGQALGTTGVESLIRQVSDWRNRRRLHPLWRTLVHTAPYVILEPSASLWGQCLAFKDAHLHLYRRVIEIRDAILILRDYVTPDTVQDIHQFLQEHHASCADTEPLVTACWLQIARQHMIHGTPPRPHALNTTELGSDNLDSEVRFLLKISHAWHTPLVQQATHRFTLVENT